MHALEKILASYAGVESVKAGEIVTAEVDLAEINDFYLQVLNLLKIWGEIMSGIRRRLFLSLITLAQHLPSKLRKIIEK